jgi:hypothetical protein
MLETLRSSAHLGTDVKKISLQVMDGRGTAADDEGVE